MVAGNVPDSKKEETIVRLRNKKKPTSKYVAVKWKMRDDTILSQPKIKQIIKSDESTPPVKKKMEATRPQNNKFFQSAEKNDSQAKIN